MRNLFALILVLLLIPMFAYAQISARFDGAQGGAVVIGESTTTCDGSIEGALRYDSSGAEVQFCDGNSWVSWGG